MGTESTVRGGEALRALAARFPQLYVAPAEGAAELNRKAATRGAVPADASLAHFATNPQDELREVETPAGPVETLFLANRADFETFLQIIGHKSEPVAIAPTVGAITYRGLADWGKVRAAYAAYVAGGGDDWGTEFARLAKQPDALRAEIVVISEGPYSNIPAEKTSFAEDEWTRISREIRLSHECAHVVCRRTMPDDILSVWDEVTADVVGLLCATGSYDAGLAALFLGVTGSGFAGGRLSEYLDEDQLARIDEIAAEVHAALARIEELAAGRQADPYEFLLELKREPLIAF